MLQAEQFYFFWHLGLYHYYSETPVLLPPHAKSWLIGKDSDAGRDWGQEEKGMTGWDGWMASLTRWTWVWVNSGSWWWTGRPGVLWFMGSQSRTWLSNWTELNWVRKWSPITQIWTYLSEGTASQISKHVLSALGDFHPFSNMALDSRQYKTVIFQKEIVRNRSRDMIWGPRGLDHLSSSRMQSWFCSCPVIFLKRPAGARKIFLICLFNLLEDNYFTILC